MTKTKSKSVRPASSIQFNLVWSRITQLTGGRFATKTGLPFVFRIEGSWLVPNRTEYKIHLTDFERAYALVPFEGPGKINTMCRGPAYVWAILHDARISQGNW